MTTYPEMNEQIVGILRFRGDSPSIYAAGRIEELEAETEQLREQAQRAEARAAGIEEMLFVAVDDYLYDNFLRGYTENHCNPEKLPVLREAFLAMLHVPPNALLEQAEAAVQEAVAREAVLSHALEATWDARESKAYRDDDVGWVFHLDGRTTDAVREALRDRSAAAATLLERLAELETLPQQLENLSVATAVLSERLKQTETQVTDMRATLQAALAPLERTADALVPPGARVEEAAALVDEALVVIREELE